MSQRAIRKRENQHHPIAATARQTLFRKSAASATAQLPRKLSPFAHTSAGVFSSSSSFRTLQNLQQQHLLLGRAAHSNPELHHTSETLERLHSRLVRTKSESDVSALLNSCLGNAADTSGRGLIGAKSEICLQTIVSHSYQANSAEQSPQTRTPHTNNAAHQQRNHVMLSGARSHRDLVQSTYASAGDVGDVSNLGVMSANQRRASECSLQSSGAYSQRTSGMSASALTLSSSVSINSNNTTTNGVLRVPIIGYEVMEERARFTVYKLRVENPVTNDCWLVLRRYTDFVRLNTKLKQSFPHVMLMLPRKKIFGDNFNSVFLDNRVQGLQMFVNSIMCKEELRTCKMVREFFCLDEPPSYSESMEECRAIFEAQEETIAHLKMQISSKNDLILSLQQKLRDEIAEKDHIRQQALSFRNVSASCARCGTADSVTMNALNNKT